MTGRGGQTLTREVCTTESAQISGDTGRTRHEKPDGLT
jgi:hypothetical protein